MKIYFIKQLLLLVAVGWIVAGAYLSERAKDQSFLESRFESIGHKNELYAELIKAKGLDVLATAIANSEYKSFDVYVVGGDKKFRTKPKFWGSDWQNLEAESRSVSLALAGEKGSMVAEDYRDVDVVTAYRPIVIDNERLALVADIDVEELLAGNFSLWAFADKLGLGLLLLTVMAFVERNRRRQAQEVFGARSVKDRRIVALFTELSDKEEVFRAQPYALGYCVGNYDLEGAEPPDYDSLEIVMVSWELARLHETTPSELEGENFRLLSRDLIEMTPFTTSEGRQLFIITGKEKKVGR